MVTTIIFKRCARINALEITLEIGLCGVRQRAEDNIYPLRWSICISGVVHTAEPQSQTRYKAIIFIESVWRIDKYKVHN